MGVFKKLGEEIADLSQLRVQTFTGNITALIDTTSGTIIEWQKLLDDAKSTGKVSLAADTKVNFDGDTELFIATDASANLVKAHNDAVAAAQQVRQGLLETFKDVLNIG